MSTKLIIDYNQRDIYTLFMELYKRKYGVDYTGAGFINDEMQLIKGAIKEHGSPHIACAALNCIKSNEKRVNVPYFIAGIRYYLTPHNPEIYFSVFRYGDKPIKKLWREFILLDSVWLPNATQRMKYKEILKTLREWANEKTSSPKKRNVNSKTNRAANN